MTLIDQIRLHPAQAQIRNEAARFNVLACGRRFGKTTLGELLLILVALQGFPVVWFAPFYKMLAEVFRDLRHLLADHISRVVASEHRLELVTGGVIDCWSLDNPNVSRGRKYARAVIDEAAMIPSLEEGWQQVIRPTLTDYEGDAFFLSTPKGINFFHALYSFGADSSRDLWRSWIFPTVANPFINPEEVERAREELPDLVFRQEYLAEFISLEDSAVFRNVSACLTAPVDPSPADHRGHRLTAGLDFGQSEDFTAISIFCADCSTEVLLDRFRRLPYAIMRDRIKAAAATWAVEEILAELNAMGTPNVEALDADGVPISGFTTTAQTKPQLIQNLVLAFEREEARWLPDPVGAAELQAYEVKVSAATGRPQYGAPAGGSIHDDTIICRALAWRQACQAPMKWM